MAKFHRTKIIKINGDKYVISSIQDIYNKYGPKDKGKLEKEIGKNILKKFKVEINGLIKKSLEIKSLKAVRYDKYYEILCEAIDSYILGHYRATIACCGIVGEYIAIELVKTLNKPAINQATLESLNQNSKIMLLFLIDKIDQTAYQKLNAIRIIRNSYIHNPSKRNKKSDAKKCINSLIDVIKIIYKP